MITERIKALLPDDLQSIVKIGELPTDIDTCIGIKECGGPPGAYFGGNILNKPHVQLAVRSPDYALAYNIVTTCKSVLTGYGISKDIGIALIGDILYLGRDGKRRNMFQITFKVLY